MSAVDTGALQAARHDRRSAAARCAPSFGTALGDISARARTPALLEPTP
ncbi:MAG: hypothetical protein AAF318_01230 [Pseudomonadota bacterium]